MKNIPIGFILYLLTFFVACGEKIDSHWNDTTLKIDGLSTDWEGIPLHYNKDMKVMYGLVNNDSILVLMVRFNDQQLARMFSMRGTTVWFNDANEKENKIGIHYVDRSLRRLDFNRPQRQEANAERESSFQAQAIIPKGQFTLAKNDSLTDISLTSIEGINAAVDYQDGLYCYEFGIALKQEKDSPYYLNISDDKMIKIGFEVSPMSEEEREKLKQEMNKRRGSGMRGGGLKGGRRGGGMSGGGMRSPERGMTNMDGVGFWLTVVLANKMEQ
jgi:hypothetical protein